MGNEEEIIVQILQLFHENFEKFIRHLQKSIVLLEQFLRRNLAK